MIGILSFKPIFLVLGAFLMQMQKGLNCLVVQNLF